MEKGKTRNYYPRPTPPNTQYEERNQFAASSYDGNAIIEWNRDGRSESEIISLLQAIVAFRSTGQSTKHDVVAIAYGFIGELAGWW